VHEPYGFRAFVEARHPSLVRFGTLLCGDLGRGEDLVQESLIKTLRAWTRVGLGEGDPEAYTRQVMTHAASRASRRTWWGERPAEPPPEQMDEAGTDASLRVDTADAVRAALAALPAQQRVALVLRFWAQLTEAEIAHELGCSTATVRGRVSRAAAALRSRGLLDEAVGGAR
jgi:RNA polymerase sigma-70 factor (sigma-E family)